MPRVTLLNCVRIAILLTLIGCPGISCSGRDEANDAQREDPKTLARENNATAKTELEIAERGADESGDRVWKQEAREFLDFDRNTANRTFELDPDWARQFVESAYDAGAEKVWVTGISEFELAGERLNMADNMVVVLPNDQNKRQAILGLYNKDLEEAGVPTIADVGQDYLLITGD
jgi:hypothetical protein